MKISLTDTLNRQSNHTMMSQEKAIDLVIQTVIMEEINQVLQSFQVNLDVDHV